jgi:adenylate cyclase
MSALRRLVQLGAADGTSPLAVGHVVFVNGVALLAASVTALTIAAGLVFSIMTPASVLYASVAGIMPPLAVLWLNARGWHAAGAIAMALYAMLSTAGAALLFGPGSGIYYFFLPIGMFAFMLFPVGRRRPALLLALLNVGAFVALSVLFAATPASAWPGEDMRRHFQINLGLVVLGTALVAYHGQRATAVTRAALRAVRERTDALLGAVLPGEFVERLREGAEVVGRRYDEVSVVVCDIAGFTKLAEEAAAEDIVRVLDTAFGEFDRICRELGAEKIKTVGDAYIAGVGLTREVQSPARLAVQVAVQMRAAVAASEPCRARGVMVRIGVGTGPVVAGVVGTHKLGYDVWGAAVDAATAMESRAEPGQIVVDAATWAADGIRLDSVVLG